jgi:hypothetical protein
MKQSNFTGKYIFDEIIRIKREVDELEKALDTLAEEVGQSSIAYKVVNEQRIEKTRLLTSLFSRKYEVINDGVNNGY